MIAIPPFLRAIRNSAVAAFAALAGLGTRMEAAETEPVALATFSSADSTPFVSDGFTASGKPISFGLLFAPPPGTVLTVVRNTSCAWITGTFDNLAQGQKVFLDFEGVSYPFVANYYGGDGNDLVLFPANSTCIRWDDRPTGVPQSLNTGILAGKTIVSVSSTDHTLILCSDGTLAALGDNTQGQLGDGTKFTSTTPKLVNREGVLKNKTVVAIATCWSSSLALCSDGTLATWGDNFYSQLGTGNTVDSSLPIAVVKTGALAGKTVTAIAAGYWHMLARCSDGTLVAWGRGANGQLGDGLHTNSTVPVTVSTSGVLSGKKVAAISAGQIHSLALCTDGTLASWGDNGYGQLGDGNSFNMQYVPAPVIQSGVLAGKTVVSIASGNAFNFALCSDGTFASWGSNTQGQLGINQTNSRILTPTLVDRSGPLGGRTVRSFAAGSFHAVAACTDGTMLFWGSIVDQVRSPVVTQEAARAGGKNFIQAASSPSSRNSVGFLVGPPPRPGSIVVSSGSGQTANISTAFRSPLVALVRDTEGLPMGGVPVTFTAPLTGASALFGSSTSVTVATNGSGLATTDTVRANGINGTYVATASYPDAAVPAQFNLGNGSSLPEVVPPVTPPGGFPYSSQTGLFNYSVTVNNTTPQPINGFRLHVDLSAYQAAFPSLRLQNRSSPSGNLPAYVDYPYPVPAGGSISLALSFYTSTRTFPNPFAPGLRVEILAASQVADTNGAGVQPSSVIQLGGNVLVEFPSTPGHWYRVRYSSDLNVWRDCPVPVQATGNRLQWIDSGPPFTDVPPSAVSGRYYIVNEIATP